MCLPAGETCIPMHTDMKTALGERDATPVAKNAAAFDSGLEDLVAHRSSSTSEAGNAISPAEIHHEGGTGISLLELAEPLDQHKAWAESGGENGQRADL